MFITNQDVFDSRDVVERIEELEALRDADELTEEDAAELAMLTEFADKVPSYISDWEYGELFIHEDYFVNYFKELLTDIGYVSRDLPNFIVIDWDATADNLKEDYLEFELDGNKYYAR